MLHQRLRKASTDDVSISQENLDVNADIQSPSDGIRCHPAFVNQRRNDQPFSVIPAYYSVRGTAPAEASGDNDNVSNTHKSCNQIRLHAARRCPAACLMENDAKSVRLQPERRPEDSQR